MKPVEFAGVNVVFAKDQPEYVPLPAMKVPNDPQGLMSVLTFNKPLQPVLLTVDLPTE